MDWAVTGIGVVTSWGAGRENFASAWRAGRVALGDLTRLAPSGPCEHAAEIVDYDWRTALISKQTFADRATQWAMGAIRGAMDDAGWTVPVPDPAAHDTASHEPSAPSGDTLRADVANPAPGAESVHAEGTKTGPVGLYLATMYGCLEAAEAFFGPVAAGKGKTASALVFSHSYPNGPAALASIEFGLRGPGMVYAGAAEAGAWAWRDADAAMRRPPATGHGGGLRLIVGAVDALSAGVLGHGAATGRHPDTRGRTPPTCVDGVDEADAAFWGRVPGEAAVFFALESLTAATSRNARVWARGDEVRTAWGAETAMAWRMGDAGAATAGLALAARLCATD